MSLPAGLCPTEKDAAWVGCIDACVLESMLSQGRSLARRSAGAQVREEQVHKVK
jgi:hypothetical protein